jgi:hypothetical protein
MYAILGMTALEHHPGNTILDIVSGEINHRLVLCPSFPSWPLGGALMNMKPIAEPDGTRERGSVKINQGW